MTKFLFTTMFFFACSGEGPDKGPGPDGTNHTNETGTAILPGTGGINVLAEFEGTNVTSQVILDGVSIGMTDEDIVNLDPGSLEFQIGEPGKRMLDEITHMNEITPEIYVFGGGSTTVVEDEIAAVDATMSLARMYHCASYACEWPYNSARGGNCNTLVDEEDQYIYLDTGGVLHGSMKDGFGGAGIGDVTLSNDVLTVRPSDTDAMVLDAQFDANDYSFGYIVSFDSIETTVQVICELR